MNLRQRTSPTTSPHEDRQVARDQVDGSDGLPCASPSGASMPKTSTFRTSSFPGQRRLPWLNERAGAVISPTKANSGDMMLTTGIETKLLPMTKVQARSPKPRSVLADDKTTKLSVNGTRAYNVHSDQQSSRESGVPGSRGRIADSSTGRSAITLSMGAPMSCSGQAGTEKTTVIGVQPQQRWIREGRAPSERPWASPLDEDAAADSTGDFDSGPLTRAITRLEGLMEEAEGLVKDAADHVNSSDVDAIEQLAAQNKTNALNSTSTARDPHGKLPVAADSQRPFLVEVTPSELSQDDSSDTTTIYSPLQAQRPNPNNTTFSKSTYSRTTCEIPKIRDFAYTRRMVKKPSREKPIIQDFTYASEPQPARPYSTHDRGQTPKLRSVSNKHEATTENAAFNRQAHTAYVETSSPKSPKTPIASQTPFTGSSLRKRSVQIVDTPTSAEEKRNWKKWAEPRQNTYFDESWQPSAGPKTLPKRKASVAPIPWNKHYKRRNGHVKLPSCVDVDVEKGESSRGDTCSRNRFRRRWQLGHVQDEPIARKWSPMRKRISAAVACFNTAMVGYTIGGYAGMVPRIQFQLADEGHDVLLGNVYLFIGMGITTFLCWPLPLLHGRKPYVLASLGLAIPLQFSQAVLVSQFRPPVVLGFEFGLLFIRFLTGILLGFTNINDFAVLLDLFGASLQSEYPHQEIVASDDARREGGGIGVWLGIWAWCWVGSLSFGFLSGAGIINTFNPQWGFYISVGTMIAVLVLNIMVPETRHSSLRRTLRELKHDGNIDERAERKVARGEIKLHISDEGPRYWFQELWAGVILMKRMFLQRGFSIMCLYLGWMYGQNVLLIVLLGALLSRDYQLPARYVGLGVLSIAIGALLAIPLSHAGLFSRARKTGPRTDSMTFEPQITWTSHMTRRIIFMTLLPIVGLIYTFTSRGDHSIHYMVPIAIAGCIGFFQALAVAECYGLVMESFDTSDLQPGVNSRHRLQSLTEEVRRRRTNYSSFPRVSAGIFLSQAIGFLFAAAATGIGGVMTRKIGAQYSTGVTAGILLFLTVLLTGVLFRYMSVQVVPDYAFGTTVGTSEITSQMMDEYWKPVIIGHPSGKVRRMNLLELGASSRWTEIRKLNNLL